MIRLLALAAVGGCAVILSGCYEPAAVPKKPKPEKIVRNNAYEEISREFARKPELRKDLGKFLEKLGEAETTDQLYAAWLEVYPDYPRVIRRTIRRSLDDFHWPVAPMYDKAVFVNGFRRGAEDVAEETPETPES